MDKTKREPTGRGVNPVFFFTLPKEGNKQYNRECEGLIRNMGSVGPGVIIYKITNKVNGKIYIGQTVRTLEERIAEHKKNKPLIISKAIRKYGIDNFTAEVIDQAETIEGLNTKEIYWIAFYNCMTPNGYNQCFGGDNTCGFKHREDSKRKMNVKKKEIFLGENNPFFGKTHSEEQREKWSKERKGRDTSKATEASLESIRRKVINLDTGEVFNSVREAARKYSIAETHISRVCRGKRKSTGGFKWQYVSG